MKLTVGKRLFGQSGLAVLLCLGVAFVALNGMRSVSEAVEGLLVTNTSLRNHMQGDMMHDALRADVFAALLAESDEARQLVRDDLKEHSDNFREMLQKNAALHLNADVATAISEIKPKLDEYIKGSETMVSLALSNKDEAKAKLPGYLALFGELEELQSTATDKIESSAQAAVEHEARLAASTKSTMLIVGTVAALMLMGSAFVIIRRIINPLRSCLEVLTACAKGDLTKRTDWKSSDEFGELAESANTLAKNFGNMIGEVQQSAIAVASAATEIASSANEMSSAVDDVAKQTTRTSESAGESGRIAREGGEVVRHTVDGMQQINNAVNASAASVTELGNRGREIGEIIKVINDIADQTNLLALNAAIEAARAGEHGRGFAVVADEVRKLAERTSKATDQVGESIKAIQNETEEAVKRMHTGTEQVKVGVELATQAGASLEQIVTGASDVAGMVHSISAAAEEAGAGARQSAEAAVQLSGKAEQLQMLVSQFKISSK